MSAQLPHLVIARRADGYIARLVGANGEIVMASELHPRREDAQHACDLAAGLVVATSVDQREVDERSRGVLSHTTPRHGDLRNPHAGDCTGTLCPSCGCCMHCPNNDGICPECPSGCTDPDCACSEES